MQNRFLTIISKYNINLKNPLLSQNVYFFFKGKLFSQEVPILVRKEGKHVINWANVSSAAEKMEMRDGWKGDGEGEGGGVLL